MADYTDDPVADNNDVEGDNFDGAVADNPRDGENNRSGGVANNPRDGENNRSGGVADNPCDGENRSGGVVDNTRDGENRSGGVVDNTRDGENRSGGVVDNTREGMNNGCDGVAKNPRDGENNRSGGVANNPRDGVADNSGGINASNASRANNNHGWPFGGINEFVTSNINDFVISNNNAVATNNDVDEDVEDEKEVDEFNNEESVNLKTADLMSDGGVEVGQGNAVKPSDIASQRFDSEKEPTNVESRIDNKQQCNAVKSIPCTSTEPNVAVQSMSNARIEPGTNNHATSKTVKSRLNIGMEPSSVVQSNSNGWWNAIIAQSNQVEMGQGMEGSNVMHFSLDPRMTSNVVQSDSRTESTKSVEQRSGVTNAGSGRSIAAMTIAGPSHGGIERTKTFQERSKGSRKRENDDQEHVSNVSEERGSPSNSSICTKVGRDVDADESSRGGNRKKIAQGNRSSDRSSTSAELFDLDDYDEEPQLSLMGQIIPDPDIVKRVQNYITRAAVEDTLIKSKIALALNISESQLPEIIPAVQELHPGTEGLSLGGHRDKYDHPQRAIFRGLRLKTNEEVAFGAKRLFLCHNEEEMRNGVMPAYEPICELEFPGGVGSLQLMKTVTNKTPLLLASLREDSDREGFLSTTLLLQRYGNLSKVALTGYGMGRHTAGAIDVLDASKLYSEFLGYMVLKDCYNKISYASRPGLPGATEREFALKLSKDNKNALSICLGPLSCGGLTMWSGEHTHEAAGAGIFGAVMGRGLNAITPSFSSIIAINKNDAMATVNPTMEAMVARNLALFHSAFASEIDNE